MRNKKRPAPEPSPEQVALERHVEDMMNPRGIPQPKPAQPLDIFQGLPAEKIPLGPVKTAPMVPGKPVPKVSDAPAKPVKSLFSSIETLKRDQQVETPVTVAVKPKLAAPVSVPPNLAAAPAPISVPKPTSLGATPPGAALTSDDTVVTVDKLARREAFMDAATDSAVADIMAKEGDDLLAAEDSVRSQQAVPIFKKPPSKGRLKRMLTSKWLLLLIPIILIALVALPYSRYKLAGLVIKKTLAVTVIDSKTTKPVSGATISYDGLVTKTNAAGHAELQVPPGEGQLSISKGYYQSFVQPETIGFGATGGPLTVNLVATGRQVPLTIVNKLTKQPVSGVTVKILGTSAISDSAGKLTIALPTKSATATATLSADGYNTTTAQVQITDSVVSANDISIVPAGVVYFLSQDSGRVDVIKTNLDGSERQTVLAGTGQEDAASTSLLASRDWKYVVLKSHREATQTGLYLIDTASGKVTQFDTSTATYTPVGWSGHNFLYDVVRSPLPQSQAGRESLKSYNADQQQLNQLDQNQAVGDATSYAYQSFNNFFIIDTQLVYNTLWATGGTSAKAYDLTSQNDSIRTITASGASKKDLQTYSASGVAYVQAAHVLPTTIDYGVYSSAAAQTTFYAYSSGGVATDSTVSAATFSKTYPTYYVSADGSKTFWNDVMSGKQSLLVGTSNAGSSTPLASANEYTAYGWYGSQYLLLSRAGSGLYIMPTSGFGSSGSPLKISNYYQSTTVPGGYGGGF